MSLTLAALIFRPSEISDRALSLGFAVALGGWDVPSPRLRIASLPDLPGFAAAFYSSGAPESEEAEHAADLFDDEQSPPACVLDAAEWIRAEKGNAEDRRRAHAALLEREARDGGNEEDEDEDEDSLSPIYALVYAEDFVHDDGFRVAPDGYQRRFVRDGDDGIEAGKESSDDSEVRVLDIDVPESATEAKEQAVFDAALRPHRGTTFLSGALGKNVLSLLVRASYDADRKVPVRLVEPDAASIGFEATRLCEVLNRVPGRGAFTPPETASGMAPPAQLEAFATAYDWHDPSDPEDLYRELSIGHVTGNLRFLREAEMAAFKQDPAWNLPTGEPLYPVAKLVPTALGGGGSGVIHLAVPPSGDMLFRLRHGHPAHVAGPTFGELLRYLSLGWSKRTAFEEDLIGALMLRAKLRAEASSR
ncbi:MAG: hypothetical protein U0441_35580 [Polyangiaceae bacterium]